jgi:hypothetical protein
VGGTEGGKENRFGNGSSSRILSICTLKPQGIEETTEKEHKTYNRDLFLDIIVT